ncbi:hypothetical protein F2Q68_00013784 [Brassica cretica]|uniref:Phytocyanin domain-containing protein n=1 Tax=Brassica cretica TaxID=69181 RepID=A0A8S9HF95_BRACR|nr:hypothetical protein F2Q68_00013784 [Brassica cretica]
MVSSQQRLSFSSSKLAFFFCILSLFSRPSLSASFLVDGVSVWKTPVVHVGDSVIYRHKYGNDLYIFRTKDAFNVCDFTQATLLTKSNSTSFTWYPSRPGSYYFSFTNNTSLPKTCQLNQKLTVMNLENLPGLEEDAVEIDNDLRSKGSYILNVIFQENLQIGSAL